MEHFSTQVLPLTVIGHGGVYKSAGKYEGNPRGARNSVIVDIGYKWGLIQADKEGSRSVGTFLPIDGKYGKEHDNSFNRFMLYGFTPLGVEIGAAEYLESLEMRQTFYSSLRLGTTRSLIDDGPEYKLRIIYSLIYNENNAAMTKEDYIKVIRLGSPFQNQPIQEYRNTDPSDKVLKAFYKVGKR